MKKVSVFSIILMALVAVSSDTTAQNLPNIIQPSPEASQLFRYQDYPIDYSTGLPQISIPLYEIKSGSLTVPISLSYHASGRRVYDQDGAVALGWSLNAGGMISRTVHGAVDFGTTAGTFQFPSDLSVSDLGSSTLDNRLVYLEKMMHFAYNSPAVGVSSWTDGEYDIFSYAFGEHSGKFFFKDNGTVKTQELVPYKPYIITPVVTGGSLGEIDILDDKGVFYKFVGHETTSQGQSSVEQVPAWTGYDLTQIISADKTDTVTFIYGYGFTQQHKSVSTQIVWNDKPLGFPGNSLPASVPEGPTESVAYPVSTYQSLRLTEIDFKQGKILFNLVSGTDKVDNIQVKNLNNDVLKTIQFNRSYLNKSDLGIITNKLDGLVFKDNTGTAIENYSFQYFPFLFNDAANQPDHTVLNERFRDYWGYYNASGVYDMIPLTDPLEYVNSGINENRVMGDPDANRSPNLAGLESGMLQKITYPTGGSTEFVFENNKYLSSKTHLVTNGPGMRLYQMKINDNNGSTILKTYTYGENESGYGMLEMEPDMTNMSTETTHNHYSTGGSDISYSYRNRVFYSDFISPLAELGERPVTYTAVTEYLGTPANNTGRTVYKYDNYAWGTAGMPAFDALTLSREHIKSFNYWNTPSLIEKSDYKASATTPRKTITYSYNTTPLETVSGLHVQRVHELDPAFFDPLRYGDPAAGPPVVHEEPYGYEYANPLINIYTYDDYQVSVGVKNLLSSTESIYNDDGSTTVNTTNYTYNSHQYPSLVTVNTSDNNVINTQTKYPFDYTGTAVYDKMNNTSVNMLAFPVENIQTKGSGGSQVPLSSVRTNYYDYGSTIAKIYPQTVDVSKGTGSYETRLRYYGYDGTGNPLSVSKEKDMPISYVWDYKNSYPVAEVKNAATADIAYTSFEADGSGNWAGINTANIVTDANAVTGSKHYSFNGTTLSKTGLAASTHYIVSYWSTTGQCTVNGSPVAGWPKTLRSVTINGITWTNYEHNVTGVTTVTVTGGNIIDELRLHPDNAQMSTYTFTPLIGMTSQADANNRVTYYEYDTYGRLKLIRDLNRNIIKTFSYKYQSTTY